MAHAVHVSPGIDGADPYWRNPESRRKQLFSAEAAEKAQYWGFGEQHTLLWHTGVFAFSAPQPDEKRERFFTTTVEINRKNGWFFFSYFSVCFYITTQVSIFNRKQLIAGAVLGMTFLHFLKFASMFCRLFPNIPTLENFPWFLNYPTACYIKICLFPNFPTLENFPIFKINILGSILYNKSSKMKYS